MTLYFSHSKSNKRSEVDGDSSLLRCYVVSTGNQLLTSRGIVESSNSFSRYPGVLDSEGADVILLRLIRVCVCVCVCVCVSVDKALHVRRLNIQEIK